MIYVDQVVRRLVRGVPLATPEFQVPICPLEASLNGYHVVNERISNDSYEGCDRGLYCSNPF
jgi:hypothetical protein